jgi:tripartite-type tricarboxylate transporter receptor subunit TctC
MKKRSLTAGLAAAFVIALAATALSRTVPYYQGKTIILIQGREPGGTGAMRAQAAIPYLRKYIPGEPTIVTQFMPGGGGRKAANYVYRNAKPDGLTIGNVGAGLIANFVLGATGVQYDLDKFIHLGTPNSKSQYVFGSVAKLGLDSIEKLRGYQGLRIGAQTVGHDIYINGRLFAWLLGVPEPKFITGFSGPELDIAMMRGELDARANIPDTILQRNPEFVQKGTMHYHAIIQIPKEGGHHHPAFAKLPELETFANTEREKKILTLFRTFRMVGSPYILPPGTPAELVAILRDAMRKTFQDPAFLSDFKKLTGDDASPLLPEEQEKIIKEIPREAEIIATFNLLAGGDPLPPR